MTNIQVYTKYWLKLWQSHKMDQNNTDTSEINTDPVIKTLRYRITLLNIRTSHTIRKYKNKIINMNDTNYTTMIHWNSSWLIWILLVYNIYRAIFTKPSKGSETQGIAWFGPTASPQNITMMNNSRKHVINVKAWMLFFMLPTKKTVHSLFLLA